MRRAARLGGYRPESRFGKEQGRDRGTDARGISAGRGGRRGKALCRTRTDDFFLTIATREARLRWLRGIQSGQFKFLKVITAEFGTYFGTRFRCLSGIPLLARNRALGGLGTGTCIRAGSRTAAGVRIGRVSAKSVRTPVVRYGPVLSKTLKREASPDAGARWWIRRGQ